MARYLEGCRLRPNSRQTNIWHILCTSTYWFVGKEQTDALKS